jgi:hypothetical protein
MKERGRKGGREEEGRKQENYHNEFPVMCQSPDIPTRSWEPMANFLGILLISWCLIILPKKMTMVGIVTPQTLCDATNQVSYPLKKCLLNILFSIPLA